MACSSILAYTKTACGAVKAGINKTYVIAYKDLVPVSGSTEPYTVSVGGVVNAIGLSGSTKFVKIEGTKNSSAFKETTAVADNGVSTITQEKTIAIDSLGAVNKTFTESLMGQPVVLIDQLKSGVYIVAGLDGQMILSGSEGTADSTNNGRSLTFSADAIMLAPEVDKTLIPSIIS